jgi:hypothetical protein
MFVPNSNISSTNQQVLVHEFDLDPTHLEKLLEPAVQAALKALLAASKNREHLVAGIALMTGTAGPRLFQALPKFHARTVSRINKSVSMVLGTVRSNVKTKHQTQEQVDSLVDESGKISHNEFFDLLEHASKAGVEIKQVLGAVLTFENPVSTVLTRLKEIALQAQHEIIRNPSGLFTWAIRNNVPIRMKDKTRSGAATSEPVIPAIHARDIKILPDLSSPDHPEPINLEFAKTLARNLSRKNPNWNPGPQLQAIITRAG